MRFKDVNQDIRVSVIFTVVSYLLIVSFSIHGFFTSVQQYFNNMLFYALPLSALSIFFSRTAVRKGIDDYNQKVIALSFRFAILATALSGLILIVIAIIT